MAKITAITYKCDVCEETIVDLSTGRHVTSNSEAQSMDTIVPSLVWHPGPLSVDLCPTCYVTWRALQGAANGFLQGEG